MLANIYSYNDAIFNHTRSHIFYFLFPPSLQLLGALFASVIFLYIAAGIFCLAACQQADPSNLTLLNTVDKHNAKSCYPPIGQCTVYLCHQH